MKATHSFKSSSTTNPTTQHQIPGDQNPWVQNCENVKTHKNETSCFLPNTLFHME